MTEQELRRQIAHNLGLSDEALERRSLMARQGRELPRDIRDWPRDLGLQGSSSSSADEIMRNLGLSEDEADTYERRTRARMTAQRDRDHITEQTNRERMAAMPSTQPWAGPLGTAKQTAGGVAPRQPVVGRPLCTMKIDEGRVARSLHKVRFGSGL